MNFDKLRELQRVHFEAELRALQNTCDRHPGIAEFVKPILDFGEQRAFGNTVSEVANVGRQLIQHIWEISGIDISGMGNSCHFNLNWVSSLNSFIGNFFLDDCAFMLDASSARSIRFKPADESNWCQDPIVLLEAAKANVAYYTKVDELGFLEVLRRGIKLDRSRVDALLNTNQMGI